MSGPELVVRPFYLVRDITAFSRTMISMQWQDSMASHRPLADMLSIHCWQLQDEGLMIRMKKRCLGCIRQHVEALRTTGGKNDSKDLCVLSSVPWGDSYCKVWHKHQKRVCASLWPPSKRSRSGVDSLLCGQRGARANLGDFGEFLVLKAV